MSAPTFHHDRPGTSAQSWTTTLSAQDIAALTLPDAGRLIVLGAHPDDETLGAGGLIRTAAMAGWQVEVLSVTAGEGSHPASPTHPPEVLAHIRERELSEAITRLAPAATTSCLGLPDGSVAEHEDEVVAHLVALIGLGGPHVLLCAPWRRDGHPDHEAAGRAAAIAASRTDARLVEYPVWLWHWGQEADVPWPCARVLEMDGPTQSAKRSAIESHASQVKPLSPAPGDEVMIGPDLLAHFSRGVEIFFEGAGPSADDALERVHRASRDPWQVDSPYERGKRAVTLASLPREHYDQALEIGCSVGALAVDLATRTEHLLAIDSSRTAVAQAQERTQSLAHVEVRHALVPGQWPSGIFDLISISEVGYFLSPDQLADVIRRSFSSLAEGGHLLLCHWRHPPVGWPLTGPAVHEAFLATGAGVLVEHHAPDFLLHVLERP